MSKKANLHLFKERITLTDYDRLIQELTCAINQGDAALTQLLFGTESLDLYSEHGSFKQGNHCHCGGLKGNRFTEKRLCKCMYYRGNAHKTSCDKCEFADRFTVAGDYRIVEYEVPAYYYDKGIGEIDLLLSDGENLYATEVKPYKNNSESLLRMIAEILTYTQGNTTDGYKKAIAFFEKNRDNGDETAQQKEYNSISPALKALIKKADITVFRFEEVDERTYTICKL